ncbi:helix-turn-helix transcriptional regulator [Diaphorobacter sp. C33]|uniref:AraC-like DNA-binding protein n=4 Tax=Diaphorobacter TaxID=238749 RepID=A0AAX1WXD8_9BURK|nr:MULTISPECIES: helix-turn-helix transcriptional regulator [Diaphorobacter]ROR49076.1 AraC-like DNA-binding protein [Diaphorobacter nitroreducens]WKK88960.1 helix-turn-helix transcriptional regulator [Diaphorobacter sp. C33]
MPSPSLPRPAPPPAEPVAASTAGRAARPVRVLSYVESLTPHLFVPSRERPVRAKHRELRADTQVRPHSHPWAQVAISTTGVLRLTVPRGTYIVPPSRALWIPPGVEHAVTMVEDADLRTLYFYQPPGRCGPAVARAQEEPWRQCRVLEVSELLRAVVREMPTDPDDGAPPPPELLHRERHLSALILDELRRASSVRLGVDLPRDKRLRHLCEAVLADPTRHDTLADWARDTGASPRTVARLFRQELGSTFTQWRQQVILARAVALAAGRKPINQIAAELGYNSPSAFSAMVRRAVGLAPGRFLGSP